MPISSGSGILFLFLSEFIDYKILLELISKSLENFTPSVCIDIESRFDELSTKFTEDEIQDELNNLPSGKIEKVIAKNGYKYVTINGKTYKRKM